MSKKSSKLDLLVRVRFENPIPEPPFPPKLLNVSTDISRLGEPSYLTQLAGSTQLPMLVDSEMGMPIDLNEFEGVWDGNDAALNPVGGDSMPTLDPADAELLTPLRLISTTNSTALPSRNTTVSWMRNTTYMQKKDSAVRRRQAAETRAEEVDASEAAQLRAIEKTFKDVHAQKAEDMKHPDVKRKHLKVVETYDILPDDDAWSNSYILLKFPERPSAATAVNPGATASKGRLERAVLRPVMEDDAQLMEYYLAKEDDVERLGDLEGKPLDGDAIERLRVFNEGGQGEDETIDDIFPNVTYDRIRTYEVINQLPTEKELLITFHEDEEEEEDMFGDDDEDAHAKKKRKGVYFKDITFRSQLRKTRAKGRGEEEARADLWDKVRVAFRDPYDEEAGDRAKRAKGVTESTWTADQLEEMRRQAAGEKTEAGEDDD